MAGYMNERRIAVESENTIYSDYAPVSSDKAEGLQVRAVGNSLCRGCASLHFSARPVFALLHLPPPHRKHFSWGLASIKAREAVPRTAQSPQLSLHLLVHVPANSQNWMPILACHRQAAKPHARPHPDFQINDLHILPVSHLRLSSRKCALENIAQRLCARSTANKPSKMHV